MKQKSVGDEASPNIFSLLKMSLLPKGHLHETKGWQHCKFSNYLELRTGYDPALLVSRADPLAVTDILGVKGIFPQPAPSQRHISESPPSQAPRRRAECLIKACLKPVWVTQRISSRRRFIQPPDCHCHPSGNAAGLSWPGDTSQPLGEVLSSP